MPTYSLYNPQKINKTLNPIFSSLSINTAILLGTIAVTLSCCYFVLPAMQIILFPAMVTSLVALSMIFASLTLLAIIIYFKGDNVNPVFEFRVSILNMIGNDYQVTNIDNDPLLIKNQYHKYCAFIKQQFNNLPSRP